MKIKNLWSVALMALVTVAGCNKEPNVEGADDNGTFADKNYLTVNIVSNSAGTRAGDTATGNYEDGKDYENAISKIRFYFFTANGSAANVKAGANGNYYDWTDVTGDGKNNPNVEKITTATIIISTKNNDKVPAKLVAICNPPTGLPTTVGLSELQKYILGSAGTGVQNLNANQFILSNSVYSVNDKTVFATEITGTNICTTEELAKANPVNVYVERVVARVQGTVSSSLTSAGTYLYNDKNINVYAAKDDKGNAINATAGNESKQIYVGLLGWNVTGIAPYASLGKVINPKWDAGLFGTNPDDWAWNLPVFFRSFWEINPKKIVLPTQIPYNGSNNLASDEMRLTYGNFANAYAQGFGTTNYAYVYPNAATPTVSENDGNHTLDLTYFDKEHEYDSYTQVIVPGILLAKNGENFEPLSLYNWLGTDYTEDGLKNAMAEMMKTELYSFIEEDVEEGGKVITYTGFSPADLMFKTLDDLNSTDGLGSEGYRRYAVWASLSDAGAAKEWVQVPANADPTEATVVKNKLTKEKVNELLKTLLAAKAWKGGLTYYYFDINHLGSAANYGDKGVVRNHIYDFTVNNIYGLGTPVYDPNEVIIPEKTVEQESYIAAKINVLSWRIVSQGVNLGE